MRTSPAGLSLWLRSVDSAIPAVLAIANRSLHRGGSLVFSIRAALVYYQSPFRYRRPLNPALEGMDFYCLADFKALKQPFTASPLAS